MRGRTMALALALAAANGSGRTLAAQQAAGFAGPWLMEYPSRITNQGGDEAVEMGHARMRLQQRGDSLTGEWQSLEPGPDGQPAPTRIMRGTVAGTHASLETTGQARMNQNGEESAIALTVRFELDLAGDSVSGTQAASTADGAALGPARKVTGKREVAGKS